MGLRVLCVTPWFPNSPTDGKYNFILHSIRSLVEAGHDVSVLVTRPWIPAPLGAIASEWRHNRQSFSRSAFKGINVELIHHLSLPRYFLSQQVELLYRSRVGARVLDLVRRTGAQIVHAHTERTAFAVSAAAKSAGVPVVTTLHGISTAPRLLNTSAKRERLRQTLAGVARVVLVGEPLRAHYAPLAGGDRNFRVVPNGFFVYDTQPSAFATSGVTRFISVSNLDEGKGIDLNLRAFAQLPRNVNWTYTIVGDGDDRVSLQLLAADLDLSDRVKFTGALAHDVAMQQLAQADVFALPSYREAFGVAYLEAMACGLLAIGVAGQGPSAFVSHGETGLLVQPRDVASLVAAMKIATDKPSEAQGIAAAGSRHVRAEFTWARHAEKLGAVFGEALQS